MTHAYCAGHTAGYRAETFAPGNHDRTEYARGYREGWILGVKYGTIVSPAEPVIPHARITTQTTESE